MVIARCQSPVIGFHTALDFNSSNYHSSGIFFRFNPTPISIGFNNTDTVAGVGLHAGTQRLICLCLSGDSMQHVGTSITAAALQHFLRFQHLNPDELQALAGQLRVETARAGQCLFCAGFNDPRDIFLLSGMLKLIATDGRSNLIDANSDAARQPIAKLRPTRYTAVAKTAVEYVLIDARYARPVAQFTRAQNEALASMEVAEITLEDFQRAQTDYLQQR
jgi:hypothetical protein